MEQQSIPDDGRIARQGPAASAINQATCSSSKCSKRRKITHNELAPSSVQFSAVSGKDKLPLSNSNGDQGMQTAPGSGHSKPAVNGAQIHGHSKEAQELFRTRRALPIWSKRADIRDALRQQDCLILVGETGSGKSTQVPQFLYSERWCQRRRIKVQEAAGDLEVAVGGMVVVTEPRRIAAQTLSGRVDREMVLSPDNQTNRRQDRAGHVVRFASNVPPNTRVKYVTEGTLLQEMVRDPNLRQYSVVIVDEIHERSVDADLIMGFLRRLLHSDNKGRGGFPLKVVVMSATLDSSGLVAFLAKPGSRPDYQPGNNFVSNLQGGTKLKAVATGTLPPSLSMQSAPLRTHVQCSQPGPKHHNENNAAAGPLPGAAPARHSSPDSYSTWSGFQSDGEETNTVFCHGEQHNDDQISTGVAKVFVEGRQYPIEVHHETTPQQDYLDAMLRQILHVHVTEPLPGDMLAFLTGQEEIHTLQAQLAQHSTQLAREVPQMQVMPLYGTLPAHEQQAAFEKVRGPKTRKIVLATNIAETSVTVLGLRYVIDSGKAKVKQYRSSLGMESLLVKSISRVSAVQRKGRAGREGPGKCWRLYTEQDYMMMEEDEMPDILRTDVLEAVLKMKARGIDDIFAFPLMDAPDGTAIRRALIQLSLLGALDETGRLTENGRKIATYPLPASYGKVLLEAARPEANCLLEAIDVISIICSESEVFLQPKTEEQREHMDDLRKELFRREGDILTYLTTLQRFAAETSNHKEWCRQRYISFTTLKNAMSVRKQLHRICLSQKLLEELPSIDAPVQPLSPERAEILSKTFLMAFVSKTATLGREGKYITTQGRHAIAIHPSSVLYGRKLEAIMFLEHVFTSKSYAKIVTSVQANWIAEAMYA